MQEVIVKSSFFENEQSDSTTFQQKATVYKALKEPLNEAFQAKLYLERGSIGKPNTDIGIVLRMAIAGALDDYEIQNKILDEANICIDDGNGGVYSLNSYELDDPNSRFNKNLLPLKRDEFSRFFASVVCEPFFGVELGFSLKDASSVDTEKQKLRFHIQKFEKLIENGVIIEKGEESIAVEEDAFYIDFKQPTYAKGRQLHTLICSFFEKAEIEEDILKEFEPYIDINGEGLSFEVLEKYFTYSHFHIYLMFVYFYNIVNANFYDLETQLTKLACGKII